MGAHFDRFAADSAAAKARQSLMSRIKLPEPIDVDSFFATRAHAACVTTLYTLNGKNFVDVRRHTMSGGRLVPTSKGISIMVTRLPDLLKAIQKAHRKAVELKLLDDEGEGAS